MERTARSVIVVGGGVAGLATAFDLEREAAARGLPLAVTVLEGAGRIGGHLQTEVDDGYRIEWGPNGFLDNEPATFRLIDRLDLRDQVLRSEDAARRRFIFSRGRLHLLPTTPGEFLGTGLLSPAAKLRVLGEIVVPPRRDRGRAAEDPAADETVAEFGRRRLGRGFTEVFLDPMVKGIFGGDAEALSLAAAFPRMVELEREHGSLFRALFALRRRRRREGGDASPGPSGVLHGFRDGMRALPERLAAALSGPVIPGAPAEAIRRGPAGWLVEAGGTTFGPCDAVVDAAPAHAAAGHVPDPELARILGAIPYSPITVITLAFDRADVDLPLDGFGMLVPGREGRRLLGVLWSASIFRGRAPRDKLLLRCMAGGADLLQRTDDELTDLALSELREPYGIRRDPERAWIFRHPRAIAQYTRGHPARLAAAGRLLAGQPGLFLTGSSYRGISVNHCLAEAERTAAAVLDLLAEAPRGA